MTHSPNALRKPNRKNRRIKLDYPVDRMLALLAYHIDASASQLANFLLTYGLTTYLTDETLHQTLTEHRSRARSVKFLWDLILPETWLELIEEYLPEEESSDEQEK
jgi:hypothetical protein